MPRYNTPAQEAALTKYLGWHGNWQKVTHDSKGNATGTNKQGLKVVISPNGKLLKRSLTGVKPRYTGGLHTEARLKSIRARKRR